MNSVATLASPEISKILFIPSSRGGKEPEGFEVIEMPVDGAVLKSYLFRSPDADADDVVVFFHGNGETAADWFPFACKIADAFKANLLIADYRGYGMSTGVPTYWNMLSDAEAIFETARRRFNGDCHIFSRGIGSAAAIHVALKYNSEGIASLVIDSGFAHVGTLIEQLGNGHVPRPALPGDFPDNVGKLRHVRVPTLFLHGCGDLVVPIEDARENYEASAALEKRFVKLPGTGHNGTILSDDYFVEIGKYVDSVLENLKKERGKGFSAPASHFSLKVLSPAMWRGYVFKGLPRRFEVGRGPAAEGTPFLHLNVVGNPRALECSRRYIRLTERAGGDGFIVELLTQSGNPCVVDGETLTVKGESAIAKVGSVITLRPDWEVEVVNRTRSTN